MIFCFSAGSIMPAESNRMSAMLPGTMRSSRKIATETPNSVSTIRPRRRSREDTIRLLLQPDVFETPVVVDRVASDPDAVYPRPPAGAGDTEIDYRPRAVFL